VMHMMARASEASKAVVKRVMVMGDGSLVQVEEGWWRGDDGFIFCSAKMRFELAGRVVSSIIVLDWFNHLYMYNSYSILINNIVIELIVTFLE